MQTNTQYYIYTTRPSDSSPFFLEKVGNYFSRIAAAVAQLFKRVVGMDNSNIQEDFTLKISQLTNAYDNLKKENISFNAKNKTLQWENDALKLQNESLKRNIEILKTNQKTLHPNRQNHIPLPIKMITEICLFPVTVSLFPLYFMMYPFIEMRRQMFQHITI